MLVGQTFLSAGLCADRAYFKNTQARSLRKKKQANASASACLSAF